MSEQLGKFRGFGFVSFEEDNSIEAVLKIKPHIIHAKEVEVKLAESKQETKSKAAADYKRTIIVTEIAKGVTEGKDKHSRLIS